MKVLHIIKSKPDETTKKLIELYKEGDNLNKFLLLYESEPDYEKLIDQIFSHEKIISWW